MDSDTFNIEGVNTVIQAIETTFTSMQRAQCSVSNSPVGACVLARNKEGKLGFFGGCNIEYASATGDHAEHVALAKAISEGYAKIEAVFVTSASFEQRAALCGFCRQYFMYVNPQCMIYLLNPDKTIKLRVTVKETLNHPYEARIRIQNQ